MVQIFWALSFWVGEQNKVNIFHFFNHNIFPQQKLRIPIFPVVDLFEGSPHIRLEPAVASNAGRRKWGGRRRRCRGALGSDVGERWLVEKAKLASKMRKQFFHFSYGDGGLKYTPQTPKKVN